MTAATEKRVNETSPREIPLVVEKEERSSRRTRPVFEMDEDKTITTIDDVVCYLRYSAYRHNQGFYHYTSFGNLNRLLTKVKIDGCERYLFKLSSPDALNDAAEVESLRGSRVLSMSYGAEENVAMWTNYGLPRKEAVRIRFSKKAVADWLERCDRSLDGLCFVKEAGDKEQYTEVKPSKVRIGDVLYVSRRNYGLAEHQMKTYCPPDGHSWLDFLNEDRFAFLKPLVKGRGWGYERETRLVVTFPDPNEITLITEKEGKIGKDVYLDFTSVITDMLNRACEAGNYRFGPWFNREHFVKHFKDEWHSLRKWDALRQNGTARDKTFRKNCDSVYWHELKMDNRVECFRTKCRQHGNCTESCECPYKES